MEIFKQNKTLTSLYKRSLSLSISKEFVDQQEGKIVTVPKQDSEQEHRRRELLAIEQQAQQEKTLKEYGLQHFKEQSINSLHKKVKQILKGSSVKSLLFIQAH